MALDPRIVIFDEATSALDNRTQQVVNDTLRRRKVTRIVIAHRLSTIRDAQRVYVLEQGRVVQAGRPADLAQEEGLFKRLSARQLT
jgi:ABC-type multidrug transport system fused ATPase/permease subunit